MKNLIIDVSEIIEEAECATRNAIIYLHNRGVSNDAIKVLIDMYRNNFSKDVVRSLVIDLVDDIITQRAVWTETNHAFAVRIRRIRTKTIDRIIDEESRLTIQEYYHRCIEQPWMDIRSNIDMSVDQISNGADGEWDLLTTRYSTRSDSIAVSNYGDYRVLTFNHLVNTGQITSSKEMRRSCNKDTYWMSMILPTTTSSD